MDIKSKQIIESMVSESMSRFLNEQMGEQSGEVTTQILKDTIIVRFKNVLPPAERQLARAQEGAELMKELKTKLIEGITPHLKVMIKTLTNAEVIDVYSDISLVTGERIEVFTLNKDLDKTKQECHL
ncbi:MAG: DUF2294 domain-containing protein [Candidatus Anammoxibacter sp.]